MNEKLPELRKKAMSLPLTPGVYLMKNKKNEIMLSDATGQRQDSTFGQMYRKKE